MTPMITNGDPEGTLTLIQSGSKSSLVLQEVPNKFNSEECYHDSIFSELLTLRKLL